MGMFFPSDDEKLPPGRRKGFNRYTQLLGRDFKQLFLMDLLTLASFIPYGLGVGYAVLSQSMLVLIPVCIIGGMIFGQGLAAMYDLILRRMRDVESDWWICFKRSLRQNWRTALLPGALEGSFLGFLIFFGAMIWQAGVITPGTLVIVIVSILLFTMVFSVWWPLAVLFDQKPVTQLKNCVLFCVRYLFRVLGTAVLQTAFWAVMVLLLPWTAFLVPFLGVWYILFLAVFLLYDQMNAAFRIEEQIFAQFPEQIPVYEDEEE